MCGIAGILHPAVERHVAVLDRMLDRIAHRGRDDRGTWRGERCVLGHDRLSIIDLSATGHQPLGNEDGSVQVVLNGEIYNYRELRADLTGRGHRFRGTSDTEVIPHLYEEHGDDFVGRLRGMFALALWDTRRGRLLLARDRAGKKPLFYAPIAGGLAFASEMKALFAVPGVDVGVRDQGVYDYLTFGVVPGEQTVYDGISRVPPAHTISVAADGAIERRRYWSLDLEPKLRIGRAEAVEETHRRLGEAVRLRLRSDVPVGCFLSGGIDSGLVTALAAQQLDRPLKTYSIGFADDAFDERPLARAVAERYGTEHTEFELESGLADVAEIIAHYDEPFSDASALPSFAVARLAGADVRVVLNGDGGDEIFAGYRHFVAARLMHRLERAGAGAVRPLLAALAGALPAPGRGRTPYQFLHRFLRVLSQGDAGRYIVLTSDRLGERDKQELWPEAGCRSSHRLIEELERQAPGLGPVDAMMFKDFHRLLGDDHLVKMDMASMAATLEARSPFLDHEVIEFVAALPEELRLPGRTTKPLLRSLAERLLPAEVATAPKRGFEIPLLRWMREDLNPMLRERVLDPASFAMTRFERGRVEALVAGRGWDAKRWAAVAWGLLCLEIWWDSYRRRTLVEASDGAGREAVARIVVNVA